MHVKRENDEPAAVSKYEVGSYRTDESWGPGHFGFELKHRSYRLSKIVTSDNGVLDQIDQH